MKKSILGILAVMAGVSAWSAGARAEDCVQCAKLRAEIETMEGTAGGMLRTVSNLKAILAEMEGRPARRVMLKDSADVEWLEVLPDKYANLNFKVVNGERVYEPYKQSLDANGKIIDSPAVRACKAIGAELPEDSDWARLMDRYEHDAHGYFTDRGREKFEQEFSDMGERTENNAHWWFASSSSVSGAPHGAHGLGRVNGIRHDLDYRDDVVQSVRCVVRPRG